MSIGSVASEQRVILRNVRWETYTCLLKDHENASSPRFTYDRGTLEICRPSLRHEVTNGNLQMIVETVAEGRGIDIVNLGSTTFRREEYEQGFEPDTCFYIQNAALMEGCEEVDLSAGDPAPDLVIEIDLTSLSLPKLPLMASLGVPEVWRYVNGAVHIYILADGSYEERAESAALPGVTSPLLNDWLAQSRIRGRIAWLRSIRAWAQA